MTAPLAFWILTAVAWFAIVRPLVQRHYRNHTTNRRDTA